MPVSAGHLLDVLLQVPKNENDNLPWLKTQNERCDTRVLDDLMVMKATP